ncbi:hypothetical protein [Rhizobium laguerreae]|uniref:hypothetical protein n=1 Tax=Rhizobium laguerreae TaxID=1076926 RepID=UPI001C8FB318|nr:hypothetical protein [Rhizobium laguerreae]MBY3363741.1 hypothetical protein [Rhizobium laguerreae]
MAIDENFLMSKIMELNTAIAQIGGKIDGFLQSQNGMQAEINGLKTRVGAVEGDIVVIKTGWSTIRNRILGGSAVVSGIIGAFLTFGWPILQKKFGL